MKRTGAELIADLLQCEGVSLIASAPSEPGLPMAATGLIPLEVTP